MTPIHARTQSAGTLPPLALPSALERTAEVMPGLAHELAGARSLAEVAPAITEAAAEAGGWDAAILWSVAPFASMLRCLGTWVRGDAPELIRAVHETRIEPGRGPIGNAWLTTGITVIDDVSAEAAPVCVAAAGDGMRSGAAAAIVGPGRTLGVLVVFSRDEHHVRTIGTGSLTTIADLAATVMERERVAREHAFDRALLESQNEATVDALLVVGPDGSIISSNRRFAEMWNIPEHILDLGSDDAAIEAVLDQVEDPSAFLSRIQHLYAHPTEHSRDEITLRDGRILDRWSAPLRHAEADITFGRAWFFRDVTEERRAERHAAFLADATSLLTSTLDYESAVGELARLTVPPLADWCVIDLVEEDLSVRRVAIAHRDPEKVAAARELESGSRLAHDPDAQRGVHHVIRTGRAELSAEIDDAWLEEVARGDATMLARLRALGLRSYMCIPLAARGRMLGVMSLISAESGRRFDVRDLAFAHALANRASLLVDNLRLYGERDRIARTLQESLLPSSLPEVPGLQLAARYRAAGEAYDVGGDFYDVFSMGRRTWGVVVGDVCGKGPDAAALTALARNTVRVASMQARKPKKILAMLNQAIYRQFDGTRFCTVTFARFQPGPDDVAVTICRGGHPPSLVLRAGGTVVSLRGQGTMIGAFDEITLADVTCRLAPGEMLVLYTDGITEARGPNGAYGEERLRATLASCDGVSAEETVERILSDVLAFTGGAASDDIALMAVRAAERPAP